jgi:hypothetical protein
MLEVRSVRAFDDDGKEIDAEYSVEQDGDHLALLLNSRGGASGDRKPRNTEYATALETLLYRLWMREACLVDGLLDTRTTRRSGTPEADRRFVESPILLNSEGSHKRALKAIMNGQQTVALASGSSGAGRRIRLRLDVPGYSPSDPKRLESDLAFPSPGIFYRSADELDESLGQTFPEGAATKVTVNRYERDKRARKACLAHYGHCCQACGIDFEAIYGQLGTGFIHVHHTKELSTLGPDYLVDPINDLRPVCPNCHAMIHRVKPALPVDELRRRIVNTRPG